MAMQTESKASVGGGPPARPSGVRHGVLGLLALAAASAYLTRHCIAVANTTIQRELHFTTEQMGWILSAFMVGYLAFQVPGGWLGTRLGPRWALSLISLLWSLFNLWSARVYSFLPMLASRIAFGAAQAGLVPIATLVINNWFPERRRGFSSASVETSMSIGGIVTMGLTAYLMERYPWREVFGLYTWVGVAWAVGFFCYFRNHPRQHPWANEAERDLITRQPFAGQTGVAATASSPTRPESTEEGSPRPYLSPDSQSTLLASMIGSRSLWGICSQQFLRAAAYAVFVSWFPAYLEKGYGITPGQAGWFAVWPLAAAVTGLMAGGFLVDGLFARTGSKRISRSLVACFGIGTAGLLTLLALGAPSAPVLVALLSASSLAGAFSGPSSWTATMDIAGRYSALLMAVMNMAGIAGALMMPIALGYLIGHIERTGGDWNLVLYLIAGTQLAAALCWLAVRPDQPLMKPADRQGPPPMEA
ncbi:MAG: MFS transporter [Acidobacteriota bacterium]|nr:MFS transporter [Acidobacteriota bacterium]